MFDENGTAVNLMALNNAMMAAAAAANNTHQPIASNHPASSGQMVVNQLLGAKDSRWLQLEVCREFQRGQCSRTDEDCKFAHPPPHVDIQNGRVTACYDSIKGRCTRDNPKCKYLHPPQHLKDQLLMNGKQHLAMKSLLCAQLTSSPTGMVANGYNPALPQLVQQSHPFVSSVPMQYFSQLPSASIYPALLGAANGGPVIQQHLNMKRSAGDKNGAGILAATNGAMYAAQAPLNPYLLQQIPAGYLQFSGQQIPPRY
jgi:hypothetical protein